MTLAKIIRQERYRYSFTLRELAKETGISDAMISLMETGKVKKPSFANVVKLSRALHIPLMNLAKTVK